MPLRMTLPAVGLSKEANIFNKVVLPEPLVPKMATNSFWRKDTDISSIAFVKLDLLP